MMKMILGKGVTAVYDKVPDGNPILEKLGRVSSQWAELEYTLDSIIASLSEHDDPITIRCITSQIMGADPRFRIILALARRKKLAKAIVGRITSIKNRTFEVSSRRNRAIHDPWYIETRKKTIAQERSISDKTDFYGVQTTDIKEIDKTLDLIEQRYADVLKVRGEVSNWRSKREQARLGPSRHRDQGHASSRWPHNSPDHEG